MSENQNNSREQGAEKYFFRASAEGFKKIPGQLIGYWATEEVLFAFESASRLGEKVIFRKGMVTADNGLFIRNWQEVSLMKVGCVRSPKTDQLKGVMRV